MDGVLFGVKFRCQPIEPKCSKVSIRRFSQLPLMLMRAGSLPPSSMSRMLAGSSSGAVEISVCKTIARIDRRDQRDTKYQQDEDFLRGRYCQWRAMTIRPRGIRGSITPARKSCKLLRYALKADRG